MKAFKYLAIALTFVIGLSACEKIELTHPYDDVNGRTALFQVFYYEPVANVAANYIDSVYVNDVLYSSVDGSGQLVTYNGVPGGGVSRFFSAQPGDIRLRFMRGGKDVYERVVNLKQGKQGIDVYDLNENPSVVELKDFQPRPMPSPADWDTDSVSYVRFVNLLYEDATTPYPGKLQYQWSRNEADAVWANVGEPVAFGEATDFEPLIIHKETYNSTGSQRVNYRILTESGEPLIVYDGSKMVEYSDWWNATLGRAVSHHFAGVRTAAPVSSVRTWTIK